MEETRNGKTPLKNKKNKQEELINKRRRKAVIIIMVEVILCLILGIGAYGVNILASYQQEDLNPDVYVETVDYNRPSEVVRTIEVTDDAGNKTYETVVLPTELNSKGYRNILVLGVDKEEENSDVMIIVSINNTTHDIKMVSILRDTLLKLEEGTSKYGYNKANSQYYSSISDTVSMINRNLGLDITEYAVVNWYGVATCINQLGGIEMTIPNEFVLSEFNGYLTDVNETTGIWAPQLSAPGTYTMSGTQVVAFCRIRHYYAWADFGRTANQREAIQKIFDKVKQKIAAGEINTILNVVQTGLGNVKTNLRLPDIMFLAMNATKYKMADSQQFPQKLASDVSLADEKYHISDCLMANDFAQEVKDLHAFLFDDDYYEPSTFVKNISYEMWKARTGN